MRRFIFTLLTITAGVLAIIPAFTQAPAANTVAFNWAFVYKQQDGLLKSWDEQQTVTRLATGDRIKFFLQPLQNAYIYLFLYDSTKKLFLLFPEHNRFFETAYRQSDEYYVPEGKVWLSVNDDAGVETFYLLVSKRRLTQLEALTKNYLNPDNGGADPSEATNQAKQAVLDEIRNVKNQYSIFQGLVEKPIIIAGDYRGGNDIRSFIKGVEVDSFYSKTIRLAH